MMWVDSSVSPTDKISYVSYLNIEPWGIARVIHQVSFPLKVHPVNYAVRVTVVSYFLCSRFCTRTTIIFLFGILIGFIDFLGSELKTVVLIFMPSNFSNNRSVNLMT